MLLMIYIIMYIIMYCCVKTMCIQLYNYTQVYKVTACTLGASNH